jgi:ABC-2 type transport system ATP-binding protein
MQTGRELLELQARLYRLPGSEVKRRVQQLLGIVDLEDAADRRVKTYSGGMQRRLDLAAALVHRPAIVFLDEPTTGLDPISREAIWRYVTELNRSEGVTFFLTTQYLEEADRLADDVAIMDTGRIVAQGSPAALKAGIATDVVTIAIEGGADELARAATVVRGCEGVEDVRTVEDTVVVYVREGGAAIAKLVLMLDEASLRAREVTLARPTLDDVFLRKTGHHLEADDRAEQAVTRRRP